MIVFVASTPITIRFFFEAIIRQVYVSQPVSIIVDRKQASTEFDALEKSFGSDVIDFSIPRKNSLKDLVQFPRFVLKMNFFHRVVRPTTLVSCSPKAALYCAAVNVLTGRRIKHIYLIQGTVWVNSGGFMRVVYKLAERFVLFASTNRLSVSRSEINVRKKHLAQRLPPIDLLGCGAIRGVSKSYFCVDRQSEKTRSLKSRLLGCEASDSTVLGFIGRITDEKGIQVILDWYLAVSKLRGDFCLLLVGPDEMSDGLRVNLTQVQETSGAQVIRVGYVRDPLPYYSVIDIFLMPSQREGFGISAIEAAAAGSLVIASDVGGLREALGSGEAGLLVSESQFDTVPEMICGYAEDNQRLDRFVSAARTYIKEKYGSPMVESRVSDYLLAKHQEAQ